MPLKSFLLDQSGVAGVGNIYADEALFRARLHPLSPAGSMKPAHLEALRDAIVAALAAGIDGGGASIDDYRDGRGEKGTMQDEFLVHTREGEPCPECDGAIVRIVVSGRSTSRGRIGAIAKGARKPRSRFGGRLEPFFRLDLILHEGRGELLTVTNASTLDGYPRLRASGPALNAGARACDAVLRPARLGRAQPTRLQPALPLPDAARRP